MPKPPKRDLTDRLRNIRLGSFRFFPLTEAKSARRIAYRLSNASQRYVSQTIEGRLCIWRLKQKT